MIITSRPGCPILDNTHKSERCDFLEEGWEMSYILKQRVTVAQALADSQLNALFVLHQAEIPEVEVIYAMMCDFFVMWEDSPVLYCVHVEFFT